jgi:hypothetical protein
MLLIHHQSEGVEIRGNAPDLLRLERLIDAARQHPKGVANSATFSSTEGVYYRVTVIRE